VTLTLSLNGSTYDFPGEITDANGYFTVTTTGLAGGMYQWRVKGPQSLANLGSVGLNGAMFTYAEMGILLTGDASDDNVVDITDFTILRTTFGKSSGDPGYDARADFNGDRLVEIGDFNLLKGNFGKMGAPPVAPDE